MKKVIAISTACIIAAAAILVTYLLYTDRMIVRLPIILQQNGKITFTMGDVFYKGKNDVEWKIAIVGTELKEGSEIKTEANAIADIRFSGDMAVKLPEKSYLKIGRLTVRELLLDLAEGSVFGKFEKVFKNHSIKVKTPTVIAAIRGTELGFIVNKEETAEKQKGDEDTAEKKETVKKTTFSTTVYSLSGITELCNLKNPDEKVLLSFQNKVVVKDDNPPSNPEALKDEEITHIKAELNSIHTDEVLFITDKINFKTGSARILPSSYPELDKILVLLNKRNIDIRIEGHTDSQGTAAFNQTLSVKRAKSIKGYFIKKGIRPDRLVVSGFGKSKPITSNRTAAGRAMNRRVEFIIID